MRRGWRALVRPVGVRSPSRAPCPATVPAAALRSTLHPIELELWAERSSVAAWRAADRGVAPGSSSRLVRAEPWAARSSDAAGRAAGRVVVPAGSSGQSPSAPPSGGPPGGGTVRSESIPGVLVLGGLFSPCAPSQLPLSTASSLSFRSSLAVTRLCPRPHCLNNCHDRWMFTILDVHDPGSGVTRLPTLRVANQIR